MSVVAPSGPFDRAAFEKGLALVSARYQVTVDPRAFSSARYLAGDDATRLASLQAAFDDPSVRGIFAARGGSGAARLLPALRLSPRPLLGFSDVTSLHAAAQVAGFRSVHGPVLTQLGQQPPEVVARLFDLLEGRPVAPLEGRDTFVGGVAEGPLLGGNLSVLTRLLGTRWMPPLDGAVLLLEDVGERPYRLDRMWTHLRLAGAFDRLAGLVLGDFNGCEEPQADYTSQQVLRSLAQETGLPCAAGFAIGHATVNVPVVLGARVRLDADAARLTFLEGLS